MCVSFRIQHFEAIIRKSAYGFIHQDKNTNYFFYIHVDIEK